MLGDDIAAVLPELRAHAESMMVDECTIERPDGTTLDPVTLEQVDTFAPVLTGQRCRVQRYSGQGRNDSIIGGVEFGDAVLLLQLPLSALGVKRGDRVRITAVAPISDPALLGVTATVKADATKTHATKRTLMCEEVL